MWHWLGTERVFFFSTFANSPLSEVWWQHHNFCINCWSSEFPYDWKLFSHARHRLPVCNPSKQMEVELAGRDSSCAFKLPQRQRALHKSKVNCSGSSTRPSNEQACKAAYCSACFCRMLQRDAEMCLFLWGHKWRRTLLIPSVHAVPTVTIVRF